MKEFAKIFDVKDGNQVLVTIDYTYEDFELHIQTRLEGVNISLKLSLEEEEDAIKKLQSFTQEKADAFRRDIENIHTQPYERTT